jgi:hypothetical protein
VHIGTDGKVRAADIEYKVSGEARFRSTTRPIHKLVLVVPVEEQVIEEDEGGKVSQELEAESQYGEENEGAQQGEDGDGNEAGETRVGDQLTLEKTVRESEEKDQEEEAGPQLSKEPDPATPGVRFLDGLEEMVDVGAAPSRVGETQESGGSGPAGSKGNGSPGSTQGECSGRCRGSVCGSWGNGSHLGSQGTQPTRRGKRRAVGIRQWRRIDITGCLKIQEMGSSQHRATFMHSVSVIVHCVVITAPTTITGIVFYCIICFRKINHLVVKNHLHSSSGVREVVSSTFII